MNPALNQLPPKAIELVHQLETYSGLEFQVLYNADLQEHKTEVFTLPTGKAVRVQKAGLAHVIAHFEANQLVQIGIEHCMNPLTVEVAAHELLHLKHIVLDQNFLQVDYSKQLNLDSAILGSYNMADYLEHLYVYREMTAFGLQNPGAPEGVGFLMEALSYQPAGLPRRIVGLMSWLQVCFCFPDLKGFAAARLLEVDLLDDARKLEATVRPILNGNRVLVITECFKAIGLRPSDVRLRFHQRHDDKWRIGSLSYAGFVAPDAPNS